MLSPFYAQLDHSIYEEVRLETGGIQRCGYFTWIENVNVVCWFNSIFSSFASLNLQKIINFNCNYLETNFLGLCIKASNYNRDWDKIMTSNRNHNSNRYSKGTVIMFIIVNTISFLAFIIISILTFNHLMLCLARCATQLEVVENVYDLI